MYTFYFIDKYLACLSVYLKNNVVIHLSDYTQKVHPKASGVQLSGTNTKVHALKLIYKKICF